MTRPLLIFLTVLFLYSCQKSNSDAGGQSGPLQSIVVYNPISPTNSTLNIQSFDYASDGRLLTYTNRTIDSVISNGTAGVSYETRIFAFNYSGNEILPHSYSLTDSN